jgi:hypothetical protein
MDALIPGLYIWLGGWTLRVGGSLAENTYSGTLHDAVGIAIVSINISIGPFFGYEFLVVHL